MTGVRVLETATHRKAGTVSGEWICRIPLAPASSLSGVSIFQSTASHVRGGTATYLSLLFCEHLSSLYILADKGTSQASKTTCEPMQRTFKSSSISPLILAASSSSISVRPGIGLGAKTGPETEGLLCFKSVMPAR